MRGKEIHVIAKVNIANLIKIGDKVIVQAVLHKENHLLVHGSGGYYGDVYGKQRLLATFGKGTKHYKLTKDLAKDASIELRDEYYHHLSTKITNTCIKKVTNETIAHKGTYKSSLIIVDGKEYPDDAIIDMVGFSALDEMFDKV